MVELVDSVDLGSTAKSVQVRVLLPAPNKVDSFDTKVFETINLFLFAKMLAAQGFLVLWFYGIVSLCCRQHDFYRCRRGNFDPCSTHDETIPREKFHCGGNSIIVS